MNAGRDYTKAKAQAQANADHDGQARQMFLYGGAWWIDRIEDTTVDGAEIIYPQNRKGSSE